MKTLCAFAAAWIAFATPALAGDPVPGVDITLEQIPGGAVYTATSDAAGNVTFANLPAGKYALYSTQKGAREMTTGQDVEYRGAGQKKWLPANFRFELGRAPQGTQLSECDAETTASMKGDFSRGHQPDRKALCQWVLDVTAPGDVSINLNSSKSN
ncbi:MAG TPA: carboxypeptidase-like regulatory domain-containing protein [Sphingomonadales bacterium]|nr:carboxypeptidase-like regulatory domain-containing protein [Sphingomonadales bacterium]